MSILMCEEEAGEAVAGFWRRETKRRQGFERRLKGEKVVRRLVMVWRGMDIFYSCRPFFFGFFIPFLLDIEELIRGWLSFLGTAWVDREGLGGEVVSYVLILCLLDEAAKL